MNPFNNPTFLKVQATLSIYNPKATNNKNLDLQGGEYTFLAHLQQKGGEILTSNDGIKGFAFTGYILKKSLLQKPPLDGFLIVLDDNYQGTYQIVSVVDLSANTQIDPIFKLELIKLND